MKLIKLIIILGFFLISLSSAPMSAGKTAITVTILYDNYVHTPGTKADWGFACLIEGTKKTILFDTGTKPEILFHNVNQLKVDVNKIDAIAISHNHGDHTGGLLAVLKKRGSVAIYIPQSFSGNYVETAKIHKATIVPVKEPAKICTNVSHTGEMGDQIKELSLILDTPKGLILVQGCSHPGIVAMVKQAKQIHKKNVYMVFGGFHLMRKSDTEMRQIIKDFKKLGVQKVGATHCTGEKAIAAFKKAFGKNYIPIGVGKKLMF